MVQIRKESILRRGKRRLIGLIKVLAASAAIPLLFGVRLLYFSPKTSIKLRGSTFSTPSLDDLMNFMQQHDSKSLHQQGSVADLDHCRIHENSRLQNFTEWIQENSLLTGIESSSKELLLQLLEIYATQHAYCDFEHYVRLWQDEAIHQAGQTLSSVEASTDEDTVSLLGIITVSHGDIVVLDRLVQALPEATWLLVHLPMGSSHDIRQAIHGIAGNHPNVVVVEYGARQLDLSLVVLRLLHWATIDLQLGYDYVVVLDDTSFPLQSIRELTSKLSSQGQRVYLSDMGRTHEADMRDVLKRRRLLNPSTGEYIELNYNFECPISWDSSICHMKVVRPMGRPAIVRRDAVRELVTGDWVPQAVALSKYAHPIVQAYTWSAIMFHMGLLDDGEYDLKSPVFALYTNTAHPSECLDTTSHNIYFDDAAILSTHSGVCYVGASNDATYRGDQVWDAIADAAQNGYLFARQFSSKDKGSLALVDRIQGLLWANEAGGTVPSTPN